MQLIYVHANLAPIIYHLVAKSHEPGANAPETPMKSIPAAVDSHRGTPSYKEIHIHIHIHRRLWEKAKPSEKYDSKSTYPSSKLFPL